ncbi:hypothetical protein [Streptomyces parvus]|uniref:hypothetical protein n=1 Tax=Streptomyces parvus TaxID=66428 RepID=UPI003F4E0ACD
MISEPRPPGVTELLRAQRPGAWALVASNDEHRVRGRFARTGLPAPEAVADADAVLAFAPGSPPHPPAGAVTGE